MRDHSARHRCLEDILQNLDSPMSLLVPCHGTSIFPPVDQTVDAAILFLELSLSSYVLQIGKHMTTILYLEVLV